MPKPQLYLFDVSPPCRAVVLTSKALKLDLELKHINPFIGYTPEFLQLNPQHTVPVLVDEDKTVIWDSHAIIIYLATKYGKNSSLYPEDPVLRARIHQHLFFESGTLFARMRFAIDTVFHHGAAEIPQDRIENVYKAYDLFEATLGHAGTKFLVGENVTLADLSCLPTVVAMIGFFPVTKEKYPKMIEWVERLKQESFYYEVKPEEADDATKVFYEKIRKMKGE